MNMQLWIYNAEQYDNSHDADKDGALTPLEPIGSMKELESVISGILATAEMFASDSNVHCFALLSNGARYETKLRNLMDEIENKEVTI